MFLVAALAVAQGVNLTGTWKTQTKSARGTSEQTMTLTQTGDNFTGEMVTAQGDKQPIKDGKVTGNDIEFNVERKQPTGETANVLYKGKITGDEITGTFKGASGADVEWTGKRSTM
jgi:hypothetical protein